MKNKIILLTLCVILLIAFVLGLYEDEWETFKIHHNISYRSEEHEQQRWKIFQKNLDQITQHNILYDRGIKSYKLGVTPFADLTHEEYKTMLGLKFKPRTNRQEKNYTQLSKENSDVPHSLDWRNRGAVTPVKEQGFCGSCWAFSVTGSVEAQYYLKHGTLISLSEQELIDCASKYGSNGCYGGEIDAGFHYIKEHGLESEIDYPYEMINDHCRINTNFSRVTIQDYVDIEPNNETALLIAVATKGPVSVAFDAAQFDMQFYKEGIFEGKACSQTELNHGVLIVGYGSTGDVDYWIVKNSWGVHFGIEGYMYMKRGVNQCGIALQPSYPVL